MSDRHLGASMLVAGSSYLPGVDVHPDGMSKPHLCLHLCQAVITLNLFQKLTFLPVFQPYCYHLAARVILKQWDHIQALPGTTGGDLPPVGFLQPHPAAIGASWRACHPV